MSSVLDTSVLSAAGRLVGMNCSGIPFKLSDRVLLKRALLWKKMQEKYEQREENSLNQETISINKLGDCSVKNLSSSCNEVVPLSTHIESPDGSWEDRQKYRKSKDSVQHWINTLSHDSVPEHANQISPFANEWPKLSSSASSEESAYVSPNTNICVQERQRNYGECDTSIKFLSKEFKNVDIVSGMTEENHTHDGVGEEEEHTFRKRSAEQSLENCSKVWDTKSERFITGSIRDRHLTHYFISCNERSLSRNRILFPADKGTPLPKKIILQNCDKSAILTNGEQLATDRVCIPKTETTVEICNNNNNNQTLREKELAAADRKSTRKQIMENHEKGPNTACDTDAGGKHRKNQISGYETHVCSGEEVSRLHREINKENVDSLCIRKGSPSTVKEVTAYRKGTLIQNDNRTRSEQKLLSGIEQNKENSGTKEKPMLRYGRKRIISDTDPPLRKDKFLFSGEEIAISQRKENETLREVRLLFSDTETSTSEDTRDVEKCSKGQVSWKEKLVPSDSNTTVSGAKSNVKNRYTRPFRKKEDTEAEVNVGHSNSGQTVRKNKLLTIDKQILLPTVQDKPSIEDKESLEYIRLQALGSGEKNETSAVGFLLADAEQRDSVAGQECYRRNPVSISRQLCEQNAASELVESCTEIERQGNLSEFAGLPISNEDCVEQSLDGASTVIIHPLLSCKYEHEVAEIRKKLKDLYDVLKDKDQGPLVIHDDRNSSLSYSCNSERSRLQHKRISMFTERKNKRCKLNLDIKHEQLSYVSETPSQSEGAKYYGHLESGDRNVLPINVSKKDMPKLSADEQGDTRSIKNENRAKNVFRCTSLQSEKEEDNINTSCSKICNSGSQTMSGRNNSSTKSTGNLVTSLQFGTKKIKHSHCNLDKESHDLKMGTKRDIETSNPAVVSRHDDDDDGETTDDDIFYYRRPKNSSLLCEKEKEINKKTIYLDSQNKSARNTSNKLSGHSLASKHCTDDRKVFSDSSGHREAETPHSVIGLEHERTESNAAGCGENTQKKCMLIKRKRETRSTNSSVRSKHNENDHVSNDSKSPKQENVLTKSKRRATALNNLVRSKYEENGDDISDDSEVPQNRKILHRWKRRSYTSYHLIASDDDKNKGNISDDGKLLNMENVSSRLKRRMKASNSAAVGCNYNETKDVSGDAENPKKQNVPSRRKNRMKMCISSDGSKYDQNESHITDDGKNPVKENVLKRREGGTEYDETDNPVIVSDVGYPSKNESVFITQEMTGMSKHHEFDDDDDDNDDIFYTTPKCSLLYKKEKEKTDNSCNENCTSLKSSRSNKCKSVTNSSSQSMLTRNVFRKSLKHSIKPVVWKNENIVDKDTSSDEKSAEIDLLTDSHKQESSGHIMERNHSSHKSDDNMDKMKMDSKLMESSRTETRKVSSVGSEHTENEEEIDDDDDDDDIFYKTPRRSLLYEKERGRMSSICGNENHTSLKSNKANKNNSSQDLSSRNNNTSRESDTCLFNSVIFRNENRADKHSSSYKSSAGIEDSNRRQFSGDIMEKTGSCNKSGDIHKIHMESKLMKSSRTETQKESSTSSEHPENEEKVAEHEDEDDDIFCYRTRKQSLPCRKEKNRQCPCS